MTFIVIEGLDGCGGETQTKLLNEYLNSDGISHIIYRSPDYSKPLGKVIKLYLDGKLKLNPDAAFTLFASDTLITSEMIKSERKEKVVIMDRYITSTIVYQAARGLDFEKALGIVNKLNYEKPDAIIYIDISPETSMKRKILEKKNLDYHEGNLEYLKKVRSFYLKEMKLNFLGKWYLVDGEKSIEKVNEQILRIIKKFF